MKVYRVCLDPGHGPGCANRSPDGSYEEQEFAMDLATRIARLLTLQGVAVHFTRDASGYPSLRQRCRVANEIENLDLFVSLHSNAAGGGGFSGAAGQLVFTSASGGARNRAADCFLRRLRFHCIPRVAASPRHQDFSVLTETKAPAVLLEHGFHTNQEELALLKDDSFRQRLAVADAQAIVDFLGLTWRETQVDPNRVRVQARFGFSEETLDYLAAYRFAPDLLRKLAEGGLPA